MWKKITEYVNNNPIQAVFFNLAFVIVFITAIDGNAAKAIEAIEAFAGVALITFIFGAIMTFIRNIFTGNVFKKFLWVAWWQWAKEWSIGIGLVYLNFWFLLKVVILFF